MGWGVERRLEKVWGTRLLAEKWPPPSIPCGPASQPSGPQGPQAAVAEGGLV